MEILVVLFLRFFVMEENEAEEEKADHHRESGGVVRVSGDDKPLVLRVLQRSNWNLKEEEEEEERLGEIEGRKINIHAYKIRGSRWRSKRQKSDLV